MIEEFIAELGEGGIQIRDRYQVELKKDFAPKTVKGPSSYLLEFYFFIPAALQIHKETYPKDKIYRDQTTYIRYKTPQMHLIDLVDWHNKKSPLGILWYLMEREGGVQKEKAIYELKLLGNMVRARMRDRVRSFVNFLRFEKKTFENISFKLEDFLRKIGVLRTNFDIFYNLFFAKRLHKEFIPIWQQVDEYISITIDHYLSGLLLLLRKDGRFEDIDEKISEILTEEKHLRVQRGYELPVEALLADQSLYEDMLYRHHQLSKYVQEILFLSTEKKEPSKNFIQFGAAVAAALAMLVYLILLASNWPLTVSNSSAFLLLTVVLYVLKDRLKEGIRNFSVKLASRWYPDFTTKIKDPETGREIGSLSEYVAFINETDLPKEIKKTRLEGFSQSLEDIFLHETILYAKKEVRLFSSAYLLSSRFRTVTDIFRFNIGKFFIKASESEEKHLMFDPKTRGLREVIAPRRYFMDVIIKSCYLNKAQRNRVDLDTYRIVFDKDGIRYVEKPV